MSLSTIEAAFLQLNTSAVAGTVSGDQAIFNNRSLAIPPSNFPPLKIKDFEVYLNNRRVPTSLIITILENGSNIDVRFDIASFLEIPFATLEVDDEVLLIGKFN